MATKLTPKQQRFVEEYLVDLNATAAARRAGYSHSTANEQGCRLLAKSNISEAVAIGRQKLSERTARTVDDVMNDIRRIAKKAEESGELNTAVRAHELEAKHLGAFTEKVELTGRDGRELSLAVQFAQPEPKEPSK